MAGTEVAIACRNLCSDDKCNTLSVQGLTVLLMLFKAFLILNKLSGNGHMCYSCEVTFNSMGQLVGWGDMACLDHPEERHLQVKMHANQKKFLKLFKEFFHDKTYYLSSAQKSHQLVLLNSKQIGS